MLLFITVKNISAEYKFFCHTNRLVAACSPELYRSVSLLRVLSRSALHPLPHVTLYHATYGTAYVALWHLHCFSELIIALFTFFFSLKNDRVFYINFQFSYQYRFLTNFKTILSYQSCNSIPFRTTVQQMDLLVFYSISPLRLPLGNRLSSPGLLRGKRYALARSKSHKKRLFRKKPGWDNTRMTELKKSSAVRRFIPLQLPCMTKNIVRLQTVRHTKSMVHRYLVRNIF